MLTKSLIQFSAGGWGCVPSLLFDPRPNCGGGNEDSGDLLQKVPCTAALSAPSPAAGHRRPTPLRETPGHSQASLAQSRGGHCSFLLGPGVHKVLFVPSKGLFPQSCVSWPQIPLASKVKFPGDSQSLCQIPRLGNLLWFLEIS